MPKYDFICADCNQSFTKAIAYEDYGRVAVECPACGSRQVKRQIGRVRLARSNGTRMQQFGEMADPQNLDTLEQNPRELGRRFRKMSEEIGEDVGPQFNEVVDRLEKGQSTDEIEKSMPDYTQASGSQSDDE